MTARDFIEFLTALHGDFEDALANADGGLERNDGDFEDALANTAITLCNIAGVNYRDYLNIRMSPKKFQEIANDWTVL